MFERLAGTPVLVIGTHFAGATAGRIVSDGDTYRLELIALSGTFRARESCDQQTFKGNLP